MLLDWNCTQRLGCGRRFRNPQDPKRSTASSESRDGKAGFIWPGPVKCPVRDFIPDDACIRAVELHIGDCDANPVSLHRLNMIVGYLSGIQGITPAAIRVFYRLTAQWVMGNYLLVLSKDIVDPFSP